MSSYNHFGCLWCGGPFNGGNSLSCSSVGFGNEFVYDPNPYSYNETPNFFNQPLQPQYETYSCELCGNDSHYGFDCPLRVPLVYEQKSYYNQNFSDNYYPQNSPSFSQQYLCCDNCGGPLVTFQCHPMNQNFNSFGFDHIQPPQQFNNHQPQEIPEVTPFVESKEWIETNNELYKMMKDFTERMNQELHKQEVLLAAQREQELLAQKQAAQENQVPSPNSVFRQLIEEICGIKVYLIESDLNSKLLLINLNSQRLNKEEQEVKNIAKPAAKRQTRITSCLQNFKVISKESTIPLCKTTQISQVNAITHDLPTEEPEYSLIMRNKEHSTIPKKESDEFIKSGVEDLIPIPKESEDTSGSDSESDVPSSDDFSPIVEEKSVTFSNLLFEFDDEYISNDVNPLFDEVLEDIECKDSYDSNLDESTLLVTPLSDANKDECFDPGGIIDEIDAFLDMDVSTDIENGYHNSEGDIIYLESLLIDDTSPNLPLEVFLDHDPRSLKDEPDNDDLMTEDKVFNPGIYEKSFSPTFVMLTFEDRHYFPITFVIRLFLPYLTYSVDSSFLLSSGNKMAKENIPAPTRSDDQLVPIKALLPYGKSNLLLDLQKLQKNPIFRISVDILQNTNFFRAFTTSTNWFPLNADLLRKALDITPVDPAHPFVSPPAGEQTFFSHRASLSIPSKKSTPHVILYCQFTKLIIYYLGSRHNIHQRPESPVHVTGDDFLLGNLKFVPKASEANRLKKSTPVKKPKPAKQMKHMKEKSTKPTPSKKPSKGKVRKVQKGKTASEANRLKKSTPVKKPKPAKQMKHMKEKSTKPTPSKKPSKGKVRKVQKGKSSLLLVDEPDEEPQPAPEPQIEDDEYNLQRGIQMSVTQSLPVVEGKGKAIAIYEQAAQSLLELLQQPKKKSTTDQYIFQRWTPVTEEASIGPYAEPQDDTSSNVVRDTPSLADAETRADTEKSNSEVELDEDQAGSEPGNTLESRTPQDEDQAGSNPGQIHESLKHTDEEHVYLENPLSSSETLSSMKNLDDAFTYGDQFLNDKLTEEEPDKSNVKIEVESMVMVPIHQASSSSPPLSTPGIVILSHKPVSPPIQEPVFTATTATSTTTTLPPPPPPQQQSTTDSALAARNHDVYSKINKYIIENVKEVVQNTLKAPVYERFGELLEFETKEILHDWMFESGSYRSQPKHIALYDTLEASMDRENREEFMDATAKSHRRRCDDQDPPPPPPKDSNQNDVHISNSEDAGTAHLLKIRTSLDWLKPVPEEERPETPELDWIGKSNLNKADLEGPSFKVVIPFHENSISLLFKMQECHLLLTDQIDLVNPEGNRVVPEVSKPLPLGGPPGQVTIQLQYFFNKDMKYLVSGNKERMNALSTSKLKAAFYQDFGLEELVPALWIKSEHEYDISAAYADYKDYKISEADFKNLHPNDFEDMNIIIRKHVEDLQLGIESYQTKLNLTEPSWDATDFLFKEDYTIVSKPRVIIYRDRNNQKKMMRESKVHKFNDGTLTRILEKLDDMVKDFMLFKFNRGVEHRIWSEDDKRRSKEFIEVIERRLKIRRIFKSLESFMSGMLRDVDYRLIQRTE
ncbi:hypothetical protein Tco_0243003 [Tanacetum coccineum]